jgi:hypothetical protein
MANRAYVQKQTSKRDGRVRSAQPEPESPVSGANRCPLCGGRLYRINRRFIDMYVSFFLPVRRYRCASLGCAWQGNIRLRR